MKLLLPLLAFLLLAAGCVSDPFAALSKNQETCYKNSLNGYPYWFECNGKKVSQTVAKPGSEIKNFTVFPEEQRVFWEFFDGKSTNFYSNDFSGNSLALLNMKPNPGQREYIENFNAIEKDFLQILKENKRLVYRLVKKNALYEPISTRIFSTNLQGETAKELAQEQKSLQSLECINVENNKLFWLFSKKDLNGNEKKAIYYNTLEGKGITLASYSAMPCNPKKPAQRSSEIKTFEKSCGKGAFYSKGDFVFWIFQDIWNSENCIKQNVTESVFATYLPTGLIKNLTQFAETSTGDYLEVLQKGIDLQGNRLVWIYYSRDTGKPGLYYNCLKGAGEPRIIDNSFGNASSEIKIEKNTVSWQANGKQFSAQLQECPN